MLTRKYISQKGPPTVYHRDSLPTDLLLPQKMSSSLYPDVTIPDDILAWPREERIQLAIAAIQGSGTNLNGHPHYSARQAEQDFGIPRSSLGIRLKGM